MSERGTDHSPNLTIKTDETFLSSGCHSLVHITDQLWMKLGIIMVQCKDWLIGITSGETHEYRSDPEFIRNFNGP
ncbi:hypothetical protein PROFUN_05400 [Planoprotostelium fungivorum]|uniref:Uncharacterized protein n=1 Tax=Planoprotostelium fungivorum TaxID=1890364 RepID=A0A2P6NQM8_9EUKA|nr:hypothetical protein PROFUN_05400 [Planoprotostelium fungivorum]